MSGDFLEQAIADITSTKPANETFPGSNTKMAHRDTAEPDVAPDPDKPLGGRRIHDHLSSPIIKRMGGEDVEFFTTANVCKAIGRSPNTVRDWINKGVLPPPPYLLPNSDGSHKRMWSRQHVEGLRFLAEKHGLLHQRKLLRDLSEFTFDAYQLFDTIKSKKG